MPTKKLLPLKVQKLQPEQTDRHRQTQLKLSPVSIASCGSIADPDQECQF